MKYPVIKKLGKIISTTIVIIIALITLMPFLWMISTSLQPNVMALYTTPPNWIPQPPTPQNYLTAWNIAPFDIFLRNSIIVTISATFLQIINALLSAYAFSWLKFPGRDVLFIFFLAVLMIPSQVTMVPNYIVMSDIGWIDTLWALIIPVSATAFGTFLIRQAFLSIPKDLIDAAVIDGASHPTILFRILAPLNKPMILTFALLSFNWRWNSYFWVLVMTNSTNKRTLPVGLAQMRGGPDVGSDWQIIMAATVGVLLPVLLLFAFFQRHFVEGVARTGLHG